MTTERRGRPVKMQDETQGTDKGADFTADMSADGRWLTYDQLAILRRIDKPSAVKLATRNRWTRRKGNAGQMQVCVPILWFERAEGEGTGTRISPPIKPQSARTCPRTSGRSRPY